MDLKPEKTKPVRLKIKYIASRKGYRFSLRRVGEPLVLAAWFLPLDQAKKIFKEVQDA